MGGEHDLFPMMPYLQGWAVEQLVACLLRVYFNAYAAATKQNMKGNPWDIIRQLRSEKKRMVMEAQASKARYKCGPGSSERSHMQPIACIMFEIIKIHKCGLTKIIIGKIELAYLGR